jgi:hypothetical protein
MSLKYLNKTGTNLATKVSPKYKQVRNVQTFKNLIQNFRYLCATAGSVIKNQGNILIMLPSGMIITSNIPQIHITNVWEPGQFTNRAHNYGLLFCTDFSIPSQQEAVREAKLAGILVAGIFAEGQFSSTMFDFPLASKDTNRIVNNFLSVLKSI